MPTMFWLWLGAVVVFLIIEISTSGLIFACFSVGALGGAVTSYFTDSYLLQLAVFGIIPIILVPLTRPLANRMTKPSPVGINVDAMIGQTGIVTKAVDPHSSKGMVRVDGQDWRVLAEVEIPEGAKIRVDKIQGARLKVSPLEEDNR